MITHFFKNAPRLFLGAFFLILSCRNEPVANDVPEDQADQTSIPREEPGTGGPTVPPAPLTATPITAGEVRFMAYNIENYLTMERYTKEEGRKPSPKDPAEVAALVKIIVSEKPDILGLCEIGTAEDLADLQERLKNAGLDLPHALHTGGVDQTRHLALLSRLPIDANGSRKEIPFQINGRDLMMGRGILDATINLPGGPTHFIGLHLKSKREMKDFDQAEIRLNEARLAREHCETIMAKDPNARLVVYGDFNDTRKTPPLAMLMGSYESPTSLSDIFVKDTRGHLWTHFWSYQQQYARFDWVLVSRVLAPAINAEKSYIVDPEIWNEASDHRAILVTLKY